MNIYSSGCKYRVLSNTFLHTCGYYHISFGLHICSFGSCSRFRMLLFGSWYYGKPLNRVFENKRLYIYIYKSLFVILNYIILPAGQVRVLQFLVCLVPPAQSNPPPEGEGLLHILILVAFPPPQVLVQDDQLVHSLHLPSTGPLLTNLFLG